MSHVGEDETIQMHGQFEGFPLTKVHEVWGPVSFYPGKL